MTADNPALGMGSTTAAPTVSSDATRVFPRYLDLAYPLIDRGQGVHLHAAGVDILDACSGGAMVTSLGHAVPQLIQAAAEQAGRIAYVYTEAVTDEPQELLAERLLAEAAPEMAKVRFVSGGSEANETAIRLARAYHVDRGDASRFRIVSPAQAYHGATMGALALSGRRGLQQPFAPYLWYGEHIPPSTWRFDPSGESALAALDEILERVGPDTVAAFFCEPVSAAALPGYSPPARFWEGLAERRERHGFLIVFDEIVTGMGRTGSWFAYQQLPLTPDIATIGKGLGAGHAPLAGVMCNQRVFDALAAGSRSFEHGHTWDGAPLPCAVGLGVLDLLQQQDLIARVASRGPGLLEELKAAISGIDLVGEVRGRGFLLGLELVDPRDRRSILPDELHVADLVDDTAFEHRLLVTSSHPNRDGYASDQTLLAPAYTSTDEELSEMVNRLAATLREVDRVVRQALR